MLEAVRSVASSALSRRHHNLPLTSRACRAVFRVEEKSHVGHMKAVKQAVQDGTSKWSAKIAITGWSALRVCVAALRMTSRPPAVCDVICGAAAAPAGRRRPAAVC